MKYHLLIPQRKLEPYALAAIKEYEKRLHRYCKITHVLYKSNEMLLKKLPSSNLIYHIKPGKSTLSSESLAEQMNHWGLMGNSTVSFIIDAEGTITDPILNDTPQLHISPLTLSSGMLTTLLTEQLYRGYRIINNQAYHK